MIIGLKLIKIDKAGLLRPAFFDCMIKNGIIYFELVNNVFIFYNFIL